MQLLLAGSQTLSLLQRWRIDAMHLLWTDSQVLSLLQHQEKIAD